MYIPHSKLGAVMTIRSPSLKFWLYRDQTLLTCTRLIQIDFCFNLSVFSSFFFLVLESYLENRINDAIIKSCLGFCVSSLPSNPRLL